MRRLFLTGAKQPKYLVTADDIGTVLAIQVQPLDVKQRKVFSFMQTSRITNHV